MRIELDPNIQTDSAIMVLHNLLQERTPQQSISHKAMPDYETHEAFVRSKPYAAWYLIRRKSFIGIENGVIVGSIYLTHQNEIGIFIFQVYQGKGFAEEAIRKLMMIHGKRRYLANVNPENKESIRLFAKFKAKHIQNTYELTP